MTSSPAYQELMVEVLGQKGLSLDNVVTTPTAGQNVRPKSSLDRGHDSLSCKTSNARSPGKKSSHKVQSNILSSPARAGAHALPAELALASKVHGVVVITCETQSLLVIKDF